jgi:hypothetical protein
VISARRETGVLPGRIYREFADRIPIYAALQERINGTYGVGLIRKRSSHNQAHRGFSL